MRIVNLRDHPEYLEKICRWHHNEWSYLNPGKTIEKRIQNMQEHLQGKAIPSTYLVVNDNVVGSASIVVTDMPERPELSPWLASVFVDPEQRKLGAGRSVVLKVMQHAKDMGIKTLYLYTPDREHFYKHMGWQTIEKLIYHEANVTLMKIDFCLADL